MTDQDANTMNNTVYVPACAQTVPVEPKGQSLTAARTYDPNLDRAGVALVPFGQKQEGRMVTNPPYQTPELGDAPDAMQTEADKLYKDLRTNQYSSESQEDKAAAAGTMWKVLKTHWKKGKDGKWVKKGKE